SYHASHLALHSFPTRRSSDLFVEHHFLSEPMADRARAAGRVERKMFRRERLVTFAGGRAEVAIRMKRLVPGVVAGRPGVDRRSRSEEHTSELQSLRHLVCRLL